MRTAPPLGGAGACAVAAGPQNTHYYACARAGVMEGGTGGGRGVCRSQNMKIWNHDAGKYRATHKQRPHLRTGGIITSTTDLTELDCYLSIGSVIHVKPPVDIHVTPGRIEPDVSTTHTIDCNTSDAEAVADALHAGTRVA